MSNNLKMGCKASAKKKLMSFMTAALLGILVVGCKADVEEQLVETSEIESENEVEMNETEKAEVSNFQDDTLEEDAISEEIGLDEGVESEDIQSEEKPEEVLLTEEMRQEYEAFLTSWAEAFVGREAESLMKLSTESAWEQMKLLNIEDTYCSFGWSSPWPMFGNKQYEILSINATEAELRYYAGDSTPYIEVWSEKVKFERQDGELKIVSDNLEFFNSISSFEEYMEAYPEGNITGTMMDYECNGLGEMLNQNAVSNPSWDWYEGYFDPLAAAQSLLNITTDSSKVKVVGETVGEETLVHIQFLKADGVVDEVTVVMYQPYGKDGIWIVK